MPAQFVAVIALACFIAGLVLGAWFGYSLAQDKVDEQLDRAIRITRDALEHIESRNHTGEVKLDE